MGEADDVIISGQRLAEVIFASLSNGCLTAPTQDLRPDDALRSIWVAIELARCLLESLAIGSIAQDEANNGNAPDQYVMHTVLAQGSNQQLPRDCHAHVSRALT
ncbi:hypothetical protein [Rhodopseudomonas sp. B29]|uniref:hypothetical protein n=1 Tax=Rhodopseudomonas sp. B29 TaxID=95607 RepID=UPI00034B9726|nr:hypothetical protein [Rhodopseudomonas sp. B29]